MSMRVPKSGSVYVYTYATLGEFFAFLIGWLAVFDYSACAAYTVKAWSLHLNYVFNKNPHEFMNPLMHHYGNDTIWDETFDSLALIGLLTAAVIVTCSIKVGHNYSILCFSKDHNYRTFRFSKGHNYSIPSFLK